MADSLPTHATPWVLHLGGLTSELPSNADLMLRGLAFVFLWSVLVLFGGLDFRLTPPQLVRLAWHRHGHWPSIWF